MALPAAVRAAVTVLKDERSRTAALTAVVSGLIVLALPVLLILSLLVLPLAGLGGMAEGELELLYALRGKYGLDQYMNESEYISGTGVDYSGVLFTDGQTQVVYYNQLDSRWADLPYGAGTIGRTGCGPTALAMVVSSLSGTAVDPIQMSAWAFDNGYEAYGNGSYHSLIPGGAAHFGLSVEGCTADDPQRIADALASGGLVVAIMGPGSFTKSGHFIVLRGVTAEGMIQVADPASKNRSDREWELATILNEARMSAGAGGPFWLIKPS